MSTLPHYRLMITPPYFYDPIPLPPSPPYADTLLLILWLPPFSFLILESLEGP